MNTSKLHLNSPEQSSFLSSSAGSLDWLARIVRAFLRVRAWTTIGLIVALLGERIASIAAFFLPLKVILLAGSDGIPKYFQFFMEPDEKTLWIYIFSLAAVVSYGLSLLLKKLAALMAEAGSMEVLQGANEILVTRTQRQEAQEYYAQFTEICANFLLLAIALVVLWLIDWRVVAVLLGLFVIEWLLPALSIFRVRARHGPAANTWFEQNHGQYLDICTSLNFLSAFFVLLIPFLVGAGGSVILAVMSILLLRQSLRAGASAVGVLAGLWAKRERIDPLVFRDVRIVSSDRPVSRDFRVLFEQRRRESVALRALQSARQGVTGLRSEYLDGNVRHVYAFHLYPEFNGTRDETHWLLQVFAEKQSWLLEHEQFLFNYIDRRAVRASPVIARYADAGFECQVIDYGAGVRPGGEAWAAGCKSLTAMLWCLEPPDQLVRAHAVSHSPLEERLTEDYLGRVSVALDSRSQIEDYERFMGIWPEVKVLVAGVPLHLHNPDLAPANIVMTSDDDWLVVNWQRWTVDRLGLSIPRVMAGEALDELVDEVRQARGIPVADFDASHLRLVSGCRELERCIGLEHYNQAIGVMRGILDCGVLDG